MSVYAYVCILKDLKKKKKLLFKRTDTLGITSDESKNWQLYCDGSSSIPSLSSYGSFILPSISVNEVAQLCPTLCDSMVHTATSKHRTHTPGSSSSGSPCSRSLLCGKEALS